MSRRGWVLGLIVSLVTLPVSAFDLESFSQALTGFTLANGLRVIVVERHDAPVIAYALGVGVGAIDEGTGEGGLAHLFEHMAFKGTATIGGREPEREREAMAAEDAAFAAWWAARCRNARVPGRAGTENRTSPGDPSSTVGSVASASRLASLAVALTPADGAAAQAAAELASAAAALAAASSAARQFVVNNEYVEILRRAGANGINAATGQDFTIYVSSVPANQLELLLAMESARFLAPVLREFYTEKQVVIEERRQRVDNRPIGRLVEALLATAYHAHPYGRPGIGYHGDLEALSRERAARFFRERYPASNLTVVLVGDVEPAEARRLTERWFGRLPARPAPLRWATAEPPQSGERRVVVEDPAEPQLLMAWPADRAGGADDAAWRVLVDLLGNGRSARLQRALVQERRVAAHVALHGGFPGERENCLVLLHVVPAEGRTVAECEAAVDAELAALHAAPVTAAEIAKARTAARARAVFTLTNNEGVAWQLAWHQAALGDWRCFFHRLAALDTVTAEQVQALARRALVPSRRTVAILARPARERDHPAGVR